MANLEARLKKLQDSHDQLQCMYQKALALIDEFNRKAEGWRDSLRALGEDREFLLSQIKQHRNTLQHPTSVDLQLYASARDVIRNPSK